MTMFEVYVEASGPDIGLFFWRYITPRGPAKVAAQEALDRFTSAETAGYEVRAAHVFEEPPVTYWARKRTRFEAAPGP